MAGGSSTSTEMSIPVANLGLSKTSWTAEDLGVESIIEDNTISAAAMAAVNAQVGFVLREVVTALLSDCPYELYWYDKTVGTSLQSYSFSAKTQDGVVVLRITGSMTFTFAVAGAYSDGTTYKDVRNSDGSVTRYYCGVDPSATAGISAAVANASAIVSDYSSAADYDKLKAFKDKICALVSYNSSAAGGGADYGDPWQLIWVFDGDDTTNVVCEGYAKAFQYLCDISNLSASVMAYSVTGTMNGGTGAGAHMWNIVHMENGKNYLVDVTNCDEGSVGAPDGLFMVGYTGGSVDEGYSFTANSRTISYRYEDKIRAVFSDSRISFSMQREA